MLGLPGIDQIADQALHAGDRPVDDLQTVAVMRIQAGVALQRVRGRLDRRQRIPEIVNDHLHDPLVGSPGVVGVGTRQVQ